MSGGGGGEQTVGYKYYLGVHHVVCHLAEKLLKIEFDDKVAWSGSATGGQQIYINKPELFGGESREGGVQGYVDILDGNSSQGQNSYLADRLGSTVPNFIGVFSVVFRQLYVGMNPYLKAPAFWVQRINTLTNGQPQWYPAKAAIGQDMNPAHIIRECLTNAEWGLGYQDVDIHNASFQAAADTLHSEGFGLSMLWDAEVEIGEFISQVLDHIDGSLYVDPSTGGYAITLARNNYNEASLLTLDETSVLSVTNFKRKSYSELTNTVTVQFWDQTTGENNSITVQDTAAISAQGGIVATTKKFLGITKYELASRVATRELSSGCAPLASCTIVANRLQGASTLKVGSVFKLKWSPLGIKNMVMRVASVEYGTHTDNRIRITCVEDVFSLGTSVMVGPPSTEWSDPISPPTPVTLSVIKEASYWDLARRLGDTSAKSFPQTSSYVLVAGAYPSSDALRANLYTRPYGNYQYEGVMDFCPVCVTAEPLAHLSTMFTYQAGSRDMDQLVTGGYAYIGNECVKLVAVNTNTRTVTIERGCIDTLPQEHPSGTVVYFVDGFLTTDEFEYQTGENARAKLCTVTSLGELAIGSAPELTSGAVSNRHYRPWPPRNIKIAGAYYPSSLVGTFDITWQGRNRLFETASLIGFQGGGTGNEDGTTYKVIIRRTNNNAIIHEATVTPTDVSTTLTIPALAYTGSIKIELQTSRGSVQSMQTFTHTCEYSQE